MRIFIITIILSFDITIIMRMCDSRHLLKVLLAIVIGTSNYLRR